MTNANGKTNSYTYNAIGKVVTVTDPLNRVQTNVYDLHGRLTETLDGRNVTTEHDRVIVSQFACPYCV